MSYNKYVIILGLNEKVNNSFIANKLIERKNTQYLTVFTVSINTLKVLQLKISNNYLLH